MHTKQDKQRFLEELRKTPVVQVACQKMSWGRTTYYRLRRGDRKFAELADMALQEGRKVVNDLGEAQTISLMKDRDMQAIRFWLTHNEPRYANKLEINGNINHSNVELTPEQKKVLRRALKLALPQNQYAQIPKEQPGDDLGDDDTGSEL